jgi:hypothetical protein
MIQLTAILFSLSLLLSAPNIAASSSSERHQIVMNGSATKYHREVVAETDELRRQRIETAKNFDYWMNYLKANAKNPDLAREALGHLSYAQGKQALAASVECKRIIQAGSDEGVAIAAVQCLNNIVHEGGISDASAWAALDFLEKQIAVQKNTGVKVQIALSLYRCGELEKTRTVFIEAFRDTAFRNPKHEFACRACVAAALAEIGGAPARTALNDALGARDIDEVTRLSIGEALIKLREDSAVIPCIDSLSRTSKNMFVRIRALKALGSLMPLHPELRKRIEEARNRDPESRVKQEAEKILSSQGSTPSSSGKAGR